jgi:hypothetical protein
MGDVEGRHEGPCLDRRAPPRKQLTVVLGDKARQSSRQPATVAQKVECILLPPYRVSFGIRARAFIRPIDDIVDEEVEVDVENPLHRRRA